MTVDPLLLALFAGAAGVLVVIALVLRARGRRRAEAPGTGVDLLSELDRQDPEGAQTRPLRVAVCILRLSTVVAAAGTSVSDERIQAILHLFLGPSTPGAFLPILARTVEEARRGVDVDRTVAELARWTDLEQRRRLVQALREVAAAGGGPTREATRVLVVLMVKLGLPEAEVDAFIDQAAGVADPDARPAPTVVH